jgi:hypothetical protein
LMLTLPRRHHRHAIDIIDAASASQLMPFHYIAFAADAADTIPPLLR